MGIVATVWHRSKVKMGIVATVWHRSKVKMGIVSTVSHRSSVKHAGDPRLYLSTSTPNGRTHFKCTTCLASLFGKNRDPNISPTSARQRPKDIPHSKYVPPLVSLSLFGKKSHNNLLYYPHSEVNLQYPPSSFL